MNRGVFIVGTDTEVGKTIITAGIVYVLKKNGINACSFKAVQSGGILKNGKLVSGDTKLVKRVCNIEENENLMNPYCLKAPVSPHLAARLEKVTINREKILSAYKKLSQKYDYIIAEGAGGLIVPIIENKYFMYDLIKDLDLPIIIVAHAGVGMINHTALTVKVAESIGLDVKGIIINKFTNKLHEKDNIEVIKNITGKKIIAVIDEIEKFEYDGGDFRRLKSEFEKKIKIEILLNSMKREF